MAEITNNLQSTHNLTIDEIKGITEQNFALIQPDWLLDDLIQYYLKKFVLDVTNQNDPDSAINIMEGLYGLMKQSGKLLTDRPDLFQDYLRMLSALKIVALPFTTLPEILRYFRENMLDVLELDDYNLPSKIMRLFILQTEPKEFDAFKRQVLQALEENTELLGPDQIVLPGKAVAVIPTLANWLKEYKDFVLNYAARASTVKRSTGGSIERVSFMQKSPNVKTLSQDERALLFKFIEVYDWVSFVDSPFAQPAQFESYLSADRFSMPEEVQLASTPAVPEDNKPQQKEAPVQVVQAKPVSPPSALPSKHGVIWRDNSVNVQEILKRKFEQQNQMGGGGLKNTPKRLNDISPKQTIPNNTIDQNPTRQNSEIQQASEKPQMEQPTIQPPLQSTAFQKPQTQVPIKLPSAGPPINIEKKLSELKTRGQSPNHNP